LQRDTARGQPRQRRNVGPDQRIAFVFDASDHFDRRVFAGQRDDTPPHSSGGSMNDQSQIRSGHRDAIRFEEDSS
jgi:hypothetical protein